jgi:hypothetical protein
MVAKAVAAVRFQVMCFERNGDDEQVFDGPMVDLLEAPAAGEAREDRPLGRYEQVRQSWLPPDHPAAAKACQCRL